MTLKKISRTGLLALVFGAVFAIFATLVLVNPSFAQAPAPAAAPAAAAAPAPAAPPPCDAKTLTKCTPNSGDTAWMLTSMALVLMMTVPGLGLANRLPIWLTVMIITRDIVIVATVAIVNLAIGRRTFRPSIFGKVATATYILTAVVAMLFNYLRYHSVVVDLFVWASLAITLVSSLHYIWYAARIIDAPAERLHT